MNIDDIMKQWQADCVIDRNNLDEVSRQTPTLHAKYLQLLSEAKLRLKREEMKQKTLLKDKWLYYNGKLSQEEIDAKGWDYDPLNGLKIMKGEMNYYYDSDKEIQDSELKVQYYKTCIDTLTDIVDSLKWRHQTIGNMIRWRIFESGG
jgi:hypothetical protein